jgi:hypothetical protein
MVTNNDGSSALPWSPSGALEDAIRARLAVLQAPYQDLLASGRRAAEHETTRVVGVALARVLANRYVAPLRRFATDAVSAIVDPIIETHGGIPQGAEAWIRSRHQAAAGNRAQSMARSLAHGHGVGADPRVESSFHAIFVPATHAGQLQLDSALADARLRREDR